MASIQFTSADRDDQGFIKAPSVEPRSLADLLPSVNAPADPTIRRRPLLIVELATIAALGLMLFGGLGYLWSGQKAATAPLPQATAYIAPTAGVATPAAPTPSPVAMLPVFASPDGAPFNQIEASRQLTVTGHYNAAWVQVDAGPRSGRVWLRASDAPQLTVGGPNLAPLAVAPLDTTDTTIEDAALVELNDPARNGNNLAPPGCPFPIINGICGNGARAKDVPDVPARPSVKASR